MRKFIFMQNQLLLPHRFKLPGWILLIVSIVAGIVLQLSDFNFFQLPARMFVFVSGDLMQDNQYLTIARVNLMNTIVGSLLVIGALMVAFSRELEEDEYIAALRLSAFQWAVLVNYLILLVSFIFIYGLPFLTVMTYNMFTVILLFIGRFHFQLFRSGKATDHEE